MGKEHTPLNSKRKKKSSPVKNGQRASKVLLHRKLYQRPMDVLLKNASNPYDSLGRWHIHWRNIRRLELPILIRIRSKENFPPSLTGRGDAKPTMQSGSDISYKVKGVDPACPQTGTHPRVVETSVHKRLCPPGL